MRNQKGFTAVELLSLLLTFFILGGGIGAVILLFIKLW